MTHKGTAVITGAVTAIGAAFADQLARRGYDLILIATERDPLLTLAAALTDSSGRSVEVLDADLAAPGDLIRVERLLQLDASITLLINHHDMAGEDDIGVALALAVTGPVRLTYALATGFVARGAGAVINLVPVMQRSSGQRTVIESASGAFALSLSQELQQQCADSGVRVQAVLYAGAQQARRQGALAIVEAALHGFDCAEAVTLVGFADRSTWHSFEAARLALLDRVAGRPPALMPSRLLH